MGRSRILSGHRPVNNAEECWAQTVFFLWLCTVHNGGFSTRVCPDACWIQPYIGSGTDAHGHGKTTVILHTSRHESYYHAAPVSTVLCSNFALSRKRPDVESDANGRISHVERSTGRLFGIASKASSHLPSHDGNTGLGVARASPERSVSRSLVAADARRVSPAGAPATNAFAWFH